MFNQKLIFFLSHALDGMVRQKGKAECLTPPDEPLQDRSGFVAGWKEFSGGLGLQGNGEAREPANGGLFVESSKNPVNQFSVSMEVGGSDMLVGYIAAASSRNQDFCANRFGTIQKGNGQIWVCLPGENAGGQSCRSGSNDGNVEM